MIGNKFGGPILPLNDGVPTHISGYGKGGLYTSVDTTTDRDNIPASKREHGMIVAVDNAGLFKNYQLIIPTWSTLDDSDKLIELAKNDYWVIIGTSTGLEWGQLGNTYISGYDDGDSANILINTADTSGNYGYIQVTSQGIDITSKNVSIGNGSSAVTIDEVSNKIKFQSNGFYATFDNDLLTTDRSFQLPNTSGILALKSDTYLLGDGVSSSSGYIYVDYTNSTYKKIVRIATTSNIVLTSYSNGVITRIGNVSFPVIDGVQLQLGERILIKDQTTALQNGIYTLTQVGVNGSSPWKLTRAADNNTSLKIYETIVSVKEGTINSNTIWLNSNTNNNLVVGTDDITYSLNGSNLYQTNLNGTGFVYANGTNGISYDTNTYITGAGAANRIPFYNGTNSFSTVNTFIFQSNNLGTPSMSITGSNGAGNIAMVAQTTTRPVGLNSRITTYASGGVGTSNLEFSWIRKNNAVSADIFREFIFPDSSVTFTYPTPDTGGADTLAVLNTAQIYSATNTYTATQQFNTIQLLDTTYKNALLVPSANILSVGSGFTNVNIGNGTSTINLGGTATGTTTSFVLGSTSILFRANQISGVSASAPINIGGVFSVTLNNPIDIGGIFNGATYLNSTTFNATASPALNLRTSSNAGTAGFGSGDINITTGTVVSGTRGSVLITAKNAILTTNDLSTPSIKILSNDGTSWITALDGTTGFAGQVRVGGGSATVFLTNLANTFVQNGAFWATGTGNGMGFVGSKFTSTGGATMNIGNLNNVAGTLGIGGSWNTSTGAYISDYSSTVGVQDRINSLLLESGTQTNATGATGNVTVRAGGINNASNAGTGGKVLIYTREMLAGGGIGGSILLDTGLTAAGAAGVGTKGGVGFFSNTTEPIWNGMQRGIFVGNATSAPLGNPTGGYFNYAADDGSGTNFIPMYLTSGGNLIKLYQRASANQTALIDSTTGTASVTYTMVDVTTTGVSAPAKVNANFATVTRLLNEIRTILVNNGLAKGSA